MDRSDPRPQGVAPAGARIRRRVDRGIAPALFCISANLTTGRAFEHRRGRLSAALRVSVSLPGILPPVVQGNDVLVDGAAINNLPVDIMQRHAPGLVIGSDVGIDRAIA